MNKRLLLLIVIAVAALNANANNISVTNVSLTGQSVAGPLATHFTMVKFDLSWDNSFRIAAGPANWDAAWVFVKFQVTGGAGCTASTAWNPATINTTGHSGPASIDGVSDTRGVFIYRSSPGTGTNTWTNFQLRWNYGTDGLLDACSVTIKVFAVEMVHVPTGAFYLGDGVIGVPGEGRFEASPYGAGNIFQVTSATTPSILGGGAAGSLGNNNTAGQTQLDDFNSGSAQVLPGTFPNGFAKFYSMKYEVGQEQYAEFLNTLTGTQQAQRTPATTAGWFHGAGAGIVAPVNRCGVKCISPPSGATPGQYASDLNNNGTVNEVAGDGRYLAMNFLSSPDLLAYLDWSGLRPMTELELEKACRGALLPVPGEFANGSAAVTAATALSNSGSDNELSTTVGSNINYNNGIGGPTRAGIFATVASTRAQAGASWYGIMDLSGNVWEDPVSVGTVAGRSFDGLHGNGALNANGAADVDHWPGINGNNTFGTANGVYGGVTGCTGYAGIGFALGTFNTGAWAQVSGRQYRPGWTGISARDSRNGGRGVRTAP